VEEHPNATLVRSVLDGLNSQNFEAMFEFVADDIEWHEIGRDEPIRGREALMARMAEMPPGASITADLHDVVANDDHTIALLTATATMGDQSLTYRVAEIYHIRDGKLTARWAFSDDTDRINRFFTPPGG
jgi:ketosteroid isomerase-like protein